MPNRLDPPALTADSNTLYCHGDWTLSHDLALLIQQIKTLISTCKANVINATELSNLDSAGAWILWKLLHLLEKNGEAPKIIGLRQEQQSLLDLVKTESDKIAYPFPELKRLGWVEQIGVGAITQSKQVFGLVSFLGELSIHLLRAFRRIWQIQWPSFLNVIDETGYRALGIVGLLCALIGVVVAYQMGQQLKIYGANIYIVSFLGVGILQEFAPLITAIIVAGRTASAFTAQIGTMQVNQEIDALRTMGLSPIDRLVIPKVLGLMIAMPLLIVWADIFGLLGGMVVAKKMLGINFYNFVIRFPHVIQLSTFFNGLIKAPVFAAIIAGVGCFQGFRVSSTADSVGRQTTRSVVQAIFLIIVADAIFSVILRWQSV